MSIVSLNPSDEKSVSYAITRFLSDFAVAGLSVNVEEPSSRASRPSSCSPMC